MTPGACEYDSRTFLMGSSHKTLCTLGGREIWTTCRDWGRCSFEGRMVPVIPDADDGDQEPEEDERERTNANVSEQERMSANKSEDTVQMTLW